MIKAIRNNIPNAITSLNLLFGCMACIMAFHCFDPMCGTSIKGYQWAFIFIALSAVADFFDGLVARLLHAVSGIGKELDSLADSVSFGLAPALVLYNIMIGQGAGHWALFALLLPVFGALRLARFNIDPNQSTVFTGLPIPANAIFWIGFTAWYAIHPVTLWIVILVEDAQPVITQAELGTIFAGSGYGGICGANGSARPGCRHHALCAAFNH